jgi:hypothetical protein
MLFVVLRLTGRGYMELFSIFVPNKDDKDEPNYIARSRPDLRHITQGSDFEAAVAKNVVNDDLRPGAPSAPAPGFSSQAVPPSSPLPSGFSSGTPIPYRPGTPPPPPPSFTPPSFNDQPDAPADAGLPPATPRLRNVDPLNRPRSNRTDNYSDDEIFGGLLDDDGDGEIDDYQGRG